MEKDIRKLIQQGESQKTEFKTSLSLSKEIGHTICAFANTLGGNILVGISDKQKIIGLDVGKNTLENLANWIKQNTDPQIYPEIKVYKLNRKNIIKISVKQSIEKPAFFKTHAFQRVGKTNQRISAGKIRELAKQEKIKLHWDERVCKRVGLADIDKEKVRWFLKKAKQERRLEIDPKMLIKQALEKLELARNSRLTNAAILLFGKNPQKFFMQAETRCARFKGIKPLKFIDMKVFAGNIIDQRDDAIEFVKDHIRLQAEIIGMERVETWEYPIEAIREAVTNAICHRNYEISANIQIRIFDDRVEIWGCGSVPEPLTVEALKGEHKSILRNSLVGKCLFLIKFIEQWGTGTNRIINSCLRHGLPEPIFKELSGDLVVILRKYHITEEILERLSERQRKIMEYLREHKKINRKECMTLLNTSKDTVYRDLSELKKNGIITRVGQGKNIYYIFA